MDVYLEGHKEPKRVGRWLKAVPERGRMFEIIKRVSFSTADFGLSDMLATAVPATHTISLVFGEIWHKTHHDAEPTREKVIMVSEATLEEIFDLDEFEPCDDYGEFGDTTHRFSVINAAAEREKEQLWAGCASTPSKMSDYIGGDWSGLAAGDTVETSEMPAVLKSMEYIVAKDVIDRAMKIAGLGDGTSTSSVHVTSTSIDRGDESATISGIIDNLARSFGPVAHDDIRKMIEQVTVNKFPGTTLTKLDCEQTADGLSWKAKVTMVKKTEIPTWDLKAEVVSASPDEKPIFATRFSSMFGLTVKDPSRSVVFDPGA